MAKSEPAKKDKPHKAKKDKTKKTDRAKQKAVKAAKTATGPVVSPLAPRGGFPALPVIKGAAFAAASAGVKYQGRTDVMLVTLAPGTTIAGTFTRSSTRAAPVLDCQTKLASKPASDTGAAILVNSGNANAFTGAAGVTSVGAITGAVAAALSIPPARVYSASTGVIGQELPHSRIIAKLPDLCAALRPDGIGMAARAIMTTDTFPKGAFAEIEIDGVSVHISGIAKGSGMIAPDMATMLVYIFTDAKIAQPVLQKMLSRLTETTFNCITVDSDTSTSDSLMLAATGQAGAPGISYGDREVMMDEITEITDLRSKGARAFQGALHAVMLDLAQQVVRDGEGATKFVTVAVSGADSDADARRVAFAIADSPLVKTAIAGEDPNWGRIVMAVGKSGAKADRDRLTICFGDVLVAEHGQVAPSYREEDGAAHMRGQDLVIKVDLGLGAAQCTVWTCDLTHRYIDINADYRS